MRSIEELLLDSGVISEPQLAVAKRDSEVRKKPLPQTLIDLGFISDRRFAEWISNVADAPIVDPLPADEVAAVESRLPAEIAREYEIVPLAVDGNTITIATVNPLDKTALDAVRGATGMNVKAVAAVYGALMDLVERFYPEAKQRVNPNSTLAIEVPFEFGTETLISSHHEPLVLDEAAPSHSQLARIEAKQDDLLRAIADLQRRIDAIDSVLARVLTRDTKAEGRKQKAEGRE